MTQLLKGTGYAYKIKGYHIIISLQDNKQNPANNDTPVSYTHLDVYKRQALWIIRSVPTEKRQYPYVETVVSCLCLLYTSRCV